MDKLIKQSIDARKAAYANSFEIDAETQKKTDALFVEIEKLGEKCKDVGEFEAEFSKSPLNQKYMDLFTEIATKNATKNAAKGAAVGAIQSAAEQALKNAVPTRAAVSQKVYDEARKVPGLGSAINVAEKASYLGHLAKIFKKKKD
ncbi:hypothetical protein IKG10_00100 [Candidatus Saccharibacteria bacterium]|nr:hypothetical protein [Candidatus Saccharibacteria bacterium]MBR3256066.1 hypothetical protein [Candidatus Saccharibacteria bacterium]